MALSRNRHNRLTQERRSRDLKWVLNQNKHISVQFGQCENSSDKRPDISFHGLPLDNKALLKTWITKMRRHPNYFNVNKHVKI